MDLSFTPYARINLKGNLSRNLGKTEGNSWAFISKKLLEIKGHTKFPRKFFCSSKSSMDYFLLPPRTCNSKAHYFKTIQSTYVSSMLMV